VQALDAERRALGGERPRPLLDGNELLALSVPPRKAVGMWIKRIQVLGLSGRLATKEQAVEYVRARLGRMKR
jgi:hypothetical protein